MVLTLDDVKIQELYNAFIDSFSDYEVQFSLDLHEFEKMIYTRSFTKKFSLGYFDQSQIAGFILIGYRKINDKNIFYDAGTGVRKEYRRKGIGNRLLNEVKNMMKCNDIDRFILEVLENNTSAIELYNKNGFTIVRKLNCYEINKLNIKDQLIKAKIRNEFDKEDKIKEYCSFEPTWQNAYESFLNAKENYRIINFEKESEVIGYGIVHNNNGNILQLGAAPKYRDMKTFAMIIDSLLEITGFHNLKYLNVEDGSEVDLILQDLNQKKTVSQYEMKYEII